MSDRDDRPQLQAVSIIRMSTDRQANSPERQRQGFRDYCATWGLDPVGEYYDPGVSASKVALLDRPAIQRLLQDAPGAAWSVVWYEEMERAARKGEELVLLENRLRKHGSFLVGPTDNPYALADEYIRKLMLFIGGWRGEGESRKISERAANSMRRLVAGGHTPGGHYPPGLGWQWDDPERKTGHYVTDEATAPLARRCFELYSDLRSIRGVARSLDAEGYVTPRNRPVGIKTVRGILHAPAYRGCRRFAGQEYPADIPEIVPPELVATVDLILAQQALRPQRALVSRAVFAGLLRCPECGRWLHAMPNSQADGRRYVNYGCGASRNVPQTCAWRRMVSEWRLEQDLVPLVAERVLEDLETVEVAGETAAGQGRQAELRRRRREQLQQERERVLTSYERGWIDEDRCAAKLRDVDARLEELDRATADDQGAPLPALTLQEAQAFAATLLRRWELLDPEDKRLLLQSVVEAVTITDPDHLALSQIDWLRTT